MWLTTRPFFICFNIYLVIGAVASIYSRWARGFAVVSNTAKLSIWRRWRNIQAVIEAMPTIRMTAPLALTWHWS